MNTLEKHYENLEHQEFLFWLRKRAYYLHRKLKQKNIKCNPRKRIVFVAPEKTNDVHVQKLLEVHNYTVQTIID